MAYHPSGCSGSNKRHHRLAHQTENANLFDRGQRPGSKTQRANQAASRHDATLRWGCMQHSCSSFSWQALGIFPRWPFGAARAGCLFVAEGVFPPPAGLSSLTQDCQPAAPSTSSSFFSCRSHIFQLPERLLSPLPPQRICYSSRFFWGPIRSDCPKAIELSNGRVYAGVIALVHSLILNPTHSTPVKQPEALAVKEPPVPLYEPWSPVGQQTINKQVGGQTQSAISPIALSWVQASFAGPWKSV